MEQRVQRQLEVMDLTLVCQSFPREPMPEIRRENILDTIERTFAGDIEVVMIEGGEGLGKTTLLAQFARRRANHAFSLFIKPASSFGCDPASLRYDLCCQLLWVLRQEESCKPEDTDEGYLRNRLLELRRRARREMYYFVIDGLGDIPDEGVRSTILDMLPFGGGFRFLLSGNLHLLPHHVDWNVCKSSQMVSFSLDETVK